MAKLYEFIPEGTKVRYLTEDEAAEKYGRYGGNKDGGVVSVGPCSYNSSYADIIGTVTNSDDNDDSIEIIFINENSDEEETGWVSMAYVEKVPDETAEAE